MVTALGEPVPFAEGFHHHNQVSRPVVEVGTEADVGCVEHPHPVPHIQVAPHFSDGVPHLFFVQLYFNSTGFGSQGGSQIL